MGCQSIISAFFASLFGGFFAIMGISTTPPQAVAVDRYVNIPHDRQADGGFVLGQPDAPVTIIVFGDFLCPHCQTYHPTLQKFIDEYVATGQARFEFRFMPAIDPKLSVETAQAAECADTLQPGTFWKAFDVLFDLASAGEYTLTRFAGRMELDPSELLACVPDASQVKVDSALGKTLGVVGVPTTFVRYGAVAPVELKGGQTLESLGEAVRNNPNA